MRDGLLGQKLDSGEDPGHNSCIEDREASAGKGSEEEQGAKEGTGSAVGEILEAATGLPR